MGLARLWRVLKPLLTDSRKIQAMEPNIWRQNFTIRSYEVDCHNRLSILSMFSFMQETAGKHADALGVSIHQLQTENLTWLLSRLKIKITSYHLFKGDYPQKTLMCYFNF